MGTLRLREVKEICPGHRASKVVFSGSYDALLLSKCFSNINTPTGPLVSLLTWPLLRGGSGVCLRFHTSDKLSGDVDAAGPGTVPSHEDWLHTGITWL